MLWDRGRLSGQGLDPSGCQPVPRGGRGGEGDDIGWRGPRNKSHAGGGEGRGYVSMELGGVTQPVRETW